MTDSELRFSLDAAMAEIPIARSRFSLWLADQGVGAEDSDELQVILSELLANAVAATPNGGPVELRAERTGGRLWLEVVNRADRTFRFPPMPVRPADPLGPRGRGLVIAEAFSDQLSGDTVDGRTHVTCMKLLRA